MNLPIVSSPEAISMLTLLATKSTAPLRYHETLSFVQEVERVCRLMINQCKSARLDLEIHRQNMIEIENYGDQLRLPA